MLELLRGCFGKRIAVWAANQCTIGTLKLIEREKLAHVEMLDGSVRWIAVDAIQIVTLLNEEPTEEEQAAVRAREIVFRQMRQSASWQEPRP